MNKLVFTDKTITCKDGWLRGSVKPMPIHKPCSLETRCKNGLDFLCRLKFQVEPAFDLKTEIEVRFSEDTLLDCCIIPKMKRSICRRINYSLDQFSQLNVEEI